MTETQNNKKPQRYYVIEETPTINEFNRKRDVAKHVQNLKASGKDCFIVKGKHVEAQIESVPQVTLV